LLNRPDLELLAKIDRKKKASCHFWKKPDI